ncbi:MAG TPA: NADPH-dependent FMN reductase [Polyangiaceae bacterium]|nr:NADPH-dependent FMN reductase [Polyangiaceae bacterium]
MTTTLIIAGSPSGTSRTLRVAEAVGKRLTSLGTTVSVLEVRKLPSEALLHAKFDDPALVEAIQQVEAADGIVIATPVYKAAYSGLLKAFLDVLPQFGLRGKVVLPLATGGSLAHVLAIDYALRPVLSSLDAWHVVSGLFLLDRQLVPTEAGGIEIEPEVSARLDVLLNAYVQSLNAARALQF